MLGLLRSIMLYISVLSAYRINILNSRLSNVLLLSIFYSKFAFATTSEVAVSLERRQLHYLMPFRRVFSCDIKFPVINITFPKQLARFTRTTHPSLNALGWQCKAAELQVHS